MRTVAAQELGNTELEHVQIQDEKIFLNSKPTDLLWNELVLKAHFARVNLSEHAHYTPPVIFFDTTKEKGHPFAYHVYGTAITIARVDCLRGIYEIESVKVVHDYGKSMNYPIDLGQTEGGIVQGVGWMTMEELMYDKDGRLMSSALSTYKVPDIYAAPQEIMVHFHGSPNNKFAIMGSKAVGEPPLLYGIGAYFAIRNAVKAYNPQMKLPYSAPITPEKVLLGLYGTLRPVKPTRKVIQES